MAMTGITRNTPSLNERRSSAHQNGSYRRMEQGFTGLRAARLAREALSGELPPKAGVAVIDAAIFRDQTGSSKRRRGSRELAFKLNFVDGSLPLVFEPGVTAIRWNTEVYKSKASGVFYVGVGVSPPESTFEIEGENANGNFPESVSVRCLGRATLKRELQSLVSAESEAYEILWHDVEALIRRAISSVVGADVVGLSTSDLVQEAWVETLRGLKQFSTPEERPSCTWSQWVMANVQRFVQRSVDRSSHLPSHDVSRAYRFSQRHSEVADPCELRERWALEQGFKSDLQKAKAETTSNIRALTATVKAAEEALERAGSSQMKSAAKAVEVARRELADCPLSVDSSAVIDNVDLDRWVSAAPALTAFDAAVKARRSGIPLSLDGHNPGSSSDGDPGHLIDKLDSELAIGSTSADLVGDMKTLLPSVFFGSGVAGEDLDCLASQVASLCRVTLASRSKLLPESTVSQAKGAKWTDLKTSVLDSTQLPRPEAAVRRAWRGFDAPITQREAVSYVNAGIWSWSDDLSSQEDQGLWAVWALRVVRLATEAGVNRSAAIKLQRLADANLPEGFFDSNEHRLIPSETVSRMSRSLMVACMKALPKKSATELLGLLRWVEDVLRSDAMNPGLIARDLMQKLGPDLCLVIAAMREAELGEPSDAVVLAIGYEVSASLEVSLLHLSSDHSVATKELALLLRGATGRGRVDELRTIAKVIESQSPDSNPAFSAVAELTRHILE